MLSSNTARLLTDFNHFFQQGLTLRETILALAELFEACDLYFGHGTDNPLDEACQLVTWLTEIPWEAIEARAQQAFPEAQKLALMDAVNERIVHKKPLPYITGIAYFAGQAFRVNEQVLIPRSPFAELLGKACQPWLTQEPQRILDLCTGSGCIGLIAAEVFPKARIDLVDISPQALSVAQLNVDDRGLQQRVSVIESDLFASLSGESYDLILTNPPYVDVQDMAALPDEYRHEPEMALASGNDGLDITRRILAEATAHLRENGLLFLEVGNSYEALEKAYPKIGFTWLELVSGGHGLCVLNRDDLP